MDLVIDLIDEKDLDSVRKSNYVSQHDMFSTNLDYKGSSELTCNEFLSTDYGREMGLFQITQSLRMTWSSGLHIVIMCL